MKDIAFVMWLLLWPVSFELSIFIAHKRTGRQFTKTENESLGWFFVLVWIVVGCSIR